MTLAIQIAEVGGPEVMRPCDVELPPPGPGELRIGVRAAGVNYIDVYFRTGLYTRPLPFGAGLEGAGVVEAVGKGFLTGHPMQGLKVGGQIKYFYGQKRLFVDN